MTLSVERLITFCVGVVIGAAIVLVISQRRNELEGTDANRDLAVIADDVSTIEETSIRAISNNAESQTTRPEVRPAHLDEETEPETVIRPISLPEIYDEHIYRRKRQISFLDIHEIFKSEARDEPWALAMESGINHSIANSGSGEWAVVEYVECRSRICEIAGYMHDDENHARDLIADFLKSGAWSGTPSTHSTRFSDKDLKRFITIISGYRIDEYQSILFSQ